MSEKRKIWVWAALLWLFIGAAVLFGMTGIYAYVTDRESTANIVTAGEVAIHLEEPSWPGKTALVAGQTVPKDPRIINDGENSALVFLRVSVPNKVITILKEDGTMEDKEGLSELFYFRYLDEDGEMTPGFNTTGMYKDPAAEGTWTELWGREVVGRTDEEFTEYVFGYSLPIRPNESTGPLFDAVKFKKVLEGYSEKSQLNPDTEYPIVLDAYAIQAEDILNDADQDITDVLDEGRGLNEEELTEIWDIYFNQNDPDHSSMHDYTPNDDRFEFMEYIPEPSRPRKEGYTFKEWYYTDGSGAEVTAAFPLKVTDKIRQNGIKFLPRWEANRYTIRFDANGGTGSMAPMELTYDQEPAELIRNAFTRKAHEFIGWFESPGGPVKFSDGQTVQNLVSDPGTVTLYAAWKKTGVTILYDANGGYFGDSSTTLNEVTYERINGSLSPVIGTPTDPSHVEMEFKGWYTNAACTDGSEFNLESCKGDITVYAKWQESSTTLVTGFSFNDTMYTLTGGLDRVKSIQITRHVPEGVQTRPISVAGSFKDASMYFNEETGTIYIATLAKNIYLNRSSDKMFQGCSSLTDISGLKDWKAGNVAIMSYMFNGCSSLTNLDNLSSWNTENLSNMSDMFNGCSTLNDINGLKDWKTENMTNMYRIFYDCSALTNLNALAGWNTRNITSTGYMFYNCKSLIDISGLTSWNTGNVTYMESTFGNCSALTNLNALADWNTEKVTGTPWIFSNCSSLTDISALSKWDVGNIKNMRYIFHGCSSLTDLSALAGWQTGSVTDMSGMFHGCSSLTDLGALAGWQTGSVTDMNAMFYGCSSLTDLGALAGWQTGSVTDMNGMFSDCLKLQNASAINDWNIANVSNFSRMFYHCPVHPEFTKCSGTWDSEGTFYPYT